MIDFTYSTISSYYVYPQKGRQDIEAQLTQLNALVVPMRAELASVAEERDALCGQLRDFAVSA